MKWSPENDESGYAIIEAEEIMEWSSLDSESNDSNSVVTDGSELHDWTSSLESSFSKWQPHSGIEWTNIQRTRESKSIVRVINLLTKLQSKQHQRSLELAYSGSSSKSNLISSNPSFSGWHDPELEPTSGENESKAMVTVMNLIMKLQEQHFHQRSSQLTYSGSSYLNTENMVDSATKLSNSSFSKWHPADQEPISRDKNESKTVVTVMNLLTRLREQHFHWRSSQLTYSGSSSFSTGNMVDSVTKSSNSSFSRWHPADQEPISGDNRRPIESKTVVTVMNLLMRLLRTKVHDQQLRSSTDFTNMNIVGSISQDKKRRKAPRAQFVETSGPESNDQPFVSTKKRIQHSNLDSVKYLEREHSKGLCRLIDILCLISTYPMRTFGLFSHNDGSVFEWIRVAQNCVFRARHKMKKQFHVPVMNSLFESFLGLNAEILTYLSLYRLEETITIQVNGKPLLHSLPFPEANDNEKLLQAIPLPSQVLDLAVDLAVVQIKTCFEYEKRHGIPMNVIAISGEGGDKVLKTLSDLPSPAAITNMFDGVLIVTILKDWTIQEIEKEIAQQLSLITGNPVRAGPMLYKCLLLLDGIHERILVDLSKWITSIFRNPNNKGSKVVLATESHIRIGQQLREVGLLEMRMEDHLVPWFSFCTNVGHIIDHASSPIFPSMAASLVTRCGGHLLATIILARSLRGVDNMETWEEALRGLSSPMADNSTPNNVVLINALKFVLGRFDYLTRHCIISCASFSEINLKKSIIRDWMSRDVMDTEEEIDCIVNNLTDAFLLLSHGRDEVHTIMMEEIREILLHESSATNHLLLRGDGLECLKDGRSNATQIHLMNNDVTELPDSTLNCPNLKRLLLQMNSELTEIPTSFFELMPNLQELNLSNTSIKSLPHSFFKLANLRKLFLRSCDVLMKLQPEIGQLHNLQVLDLEDTDIINLPAEIGNLIKLTCLKVSFCGYMSGSREVESMIPEGVLSKLSQLRELRIEVDPEDRRWEGVVKMVIKQLVHLKQLKSLQMYLPEAELLDELKANVPSLLHDSTAEFSLDVNNHTRRIMSRAPLGVEGKFANWKKRLKYINCKGSVASQVMDVLKYTDAFYLDRHFTITKLSEFGILNMGNLRFCVLGGCNELQTIVEALDADLYIGNGDDELVYSENPILPKLEHFVIYNMKKLRSVLKGPLCYGSLSRLKTLTLQGCPELRIVFTLGSVVALTHLEELTVEDCPVFVSLITWNSKSTTGLLELRTRQFIGKLKKMSLHYLPELRSISGGLSIAPTIEKISVYNCPNLKNLWNNDISSTSSLKIIRGENEWWNALEGTPEKLGEVFVPIRSDEDLVTQLAADGFT